MTERSRVVTAACAGAVLGGVWGWLYLTTSGGRVRDYLRPAIDRLDDELSKAQARGEKTRAAIDNGRRLLADLAAAGRSVS